jgi:hypothetical protein
VIDDLAAVLKEHLGAGRRRTDELLAVLGAFDRLRLELDDLEAQALIEARRRGMDWRQISQAQGLKSPQAASQRYQRRVTRLEEMRQGIR